MLMRPAFIAFFIVSAPAGAFANSPGQGNSTGEFVTTCGGIGTGGAVAGGESIFVSPPNLGGFGMFDGAHTANCNWTTATITGGTISESASINSTFDALNYSASAQGKVKPGVMNLQSTSTGPAAVQFPTGAAQGGWTDQLDITGQPSGTSGIFVFKVHVDGDLDASGLFARPGFTVTPYLNGNLLARNTQFDSLNPDPVIGSPESLGYQSRIWFNPGSDSVPTLTVNGDVFFAIPFTFGTSFDLGLYAYTYSSNGSFGPNFTVNNNQSLFQSTIALDGIEEVLAGPSDTPVTGYTIAAASGLNYAESQVPTPTVPEPATWAMLLGGGALLSLLHRRRVSAGKTLQPSLQPIRA
jgi:PEP-CTERM motif